jgi:O-antigen ligase
MKLNRIFYWLLGAVMFLPVSFEIAGTEIFFVQQFTAIALLLFFAATKRLTFFDRLSTLDQLVGIYFVWIFISYLANVAASASDFHLEVELRRILSLSMTCSLLMGYVIGRSLHWELSGRLKAFNAGLVVTFAGLSAFYLWMLHKAGLADLFLAREAIGQRMPLMICYMTIICFVYALFRKQTRFRLYALAVLGLIVVLLSLTRAAYIQLFISGVMIFCYISPRNRVRIGALAVLLAISYVVYAQYDKQAGMQSVETVTQRLTNITQVTESVESDASGGFRIAMWRAIIAKLSENPVRWLVGFGSLGPSSVIDSVDYSFGTTAGSSAHSQYLDILVREGVAGLLLFGIICLKMIRLGLAKARWPDGEVRYIVFAHAVAMAGVMAYGFFHETVRYPIFGVFFWIYAGSLGSLQATTTDKSPVEARRSGSAQ